MAKDARLELGRYISNPFNRQGQVSRRLDFNDLFRAKPDTGDYPWNPSRFSEQDLLKRAMTRKLTENPVLNFVPNSPFFDDNTAVTPEYELFDGIGRFNRPIEYDFDNGRAKTQQRPEDQPDFNPAWVEAYRLSPTISPDKTARNPMPRLRNPDPNGFLMRSAEAQVESEINNEQSVASLLENSEFTTRFAKVKEEQQAAELQKKEEVSYE